MCYIVGWKISTFMIFSFLAIVSVFSLKQSPECLEGYKANPHNWAGCVRCNDSGTAAEKDACNKKEKGGFTHKKSPKCILGFKASAADKSDCSFCKDDINCCLYEGDHYESRCGPYRLKPSPDCASGYKKDFSKPYHCISTLDPREIGGVPSSCKKSKHCTLGFELSACQLCSDKSCCSAEGNPRFCQDK